jgi:predicted transcriptional regulator
MARADDLPELSRAELDILRILWEGGRASAREVHEKIGETYDWAYSTTRTMLDRTVTKGYVGREAFHGINLYAPVLSRPKGLARLVRDFADRVLEGDPATVVALFAGGSQLTEAEIDELERLVDGLDG